MSLRALTKAIGRMPIFCDVDRIARIDHSYGNGKFFIICQWTGHNLVGNGTTKRPALLGGIREDSAEIWTVIAKAYDVVPLSKPQVNEAEGAPISLKKFTQQMWWRVVDNIDPLQTRRKTETTHLHRKNWKKKSSVRKKQTKNAQVLDFETSLGKHFMWSTNVEHVSVAPAPLKSCRTLDEERIRFGRKTQRTPQHIIGSWSQILRRSPFYRHLLSSGQPQKQHG